MRNLGDITQINGYTAPAVDVIIGGSPCQGLSNAGLKKGLDDDRSGLFMEQIRVTKEMREQDVRSGRTGVDVRPRYLVWENVPGALSTNEKRDFQAVLTEIVRISEPKAPPVPIPDKGWPNAGVLMGDGWSLAWRILDAQFWGVPQRRRRIALVADFGGQSAPEILFVSEGVSGNTEPSKQKRETAPGDAGNSTERAVPYTMQVRCGCEGGVKAPSSKPTSQQLSPRATSKPSSNPTAFSDVASTLRAGAGAPKHQQDMVGRLVAQPVCYNGVSITSALNRTDPQPGDPCHTLTSDERNYVVSIENHPADSRVKIDESGVCQTLTSRMGTGGGDVPLIGILNRDDIHQEHSG